MFHYSIFFSKETEPDLVSLPFCFEADIALPADAMQREWVTALTDPARSWLWPKELSLPTVAEPPIRQGGYFSLAYQMPDPANLNAPPKHYVYDYSIVRWHPEEMLFQYQAENGNGKKHPFMGGGTVTITSTGPDQCRFKWQGAYKHTGNRQGAEDVFAHYFSLFFTTMAKNIRQHFGPKH
jgi:hypothetical protein